MRQHTYKNYDNDFYGWTKAQANYLKKGEYDKVDLKNLIEEIESLGRSEKKALESYLEKLLMHMLKFKYQPLMKTRSWDLTIKNCRKKANEILLDNPSLKPKLSEVVKRAYSSAKILAADETGLDEKTFPEDCPWSLKEIME